MSLLTWSALLYASLTAVCLSMSRHHRDAFEGRQPWPGPGVLRALGFMGIGISLICCLVSAPGGKSWVMWFCAFTALGYAINLALAYAPRFMPLAGKVALGVALVSAAVQVLG